MVFTPQTHGETEARNLGRTFPKEVLPAVSAALVPEAPREPRAPRSSPCAPESPEGSGGPGGASAGERRKSRGPRPPPPGEPRWAARGGRRGRYSPRAVERVPRRGADRRAGGWARVRRGRATAAGTLPPLPPPLPPPPGLPPRLPALGGPAPSPPWAGPSLCPRPGPRAAAWARGGAEARRWAPRAHTLGGCTRGAGLGPCSCRRAALCACSPAENARSCGSWRRRGPSLLPTHRHPTPPPPATQARPLRKE